MDENSSIRVFLLDLQHRVHPAQIIDLIVERRTQEVYRRCVDLSRADNKLEFDQYIDGIIHNPINPIAIPTLIACAIFFDGIYSSLIESIMSGNVVKDIEIEIAKIAELDVEIDTDRLLDCIDCYVKGLYHYILAVKCGRWKLMYTAYRSIVDKIYDQCDNYNEVVPISREYGINIYKLRMDAWIMFNDELKRALSIKVSSPEDDERTKVAIQFLVSYGMSQNDAWHNCREKAQYDFELSKRLINSNSTSKDYRIRKVLQKIVLLEYLMRFSQALYWWNPMEIEAKGVAVDAMREFDKEGSHFSW